MFPFGNGFWNHDILSHEMCILQTIRKICNASLMYRNVLVSYHTMKSCSLLLASLMPAGMDSSNRSDWLVTFPCQGKEAIHYPFRASLHSLVPAGGLTHLSILLTENTPPEPVCSFELSILTVLLFRRVPYHFRRGQYT